MAHLRVLLAVLFFAAPFVAATAEAQALPATGPLLVPIAPQQPRIAIDVAIDLTLHTDTVPPPSSRRSERRGRHAIRLLVAGPILLAAGYVLAAAWPMPSENDPYTLVDEGRESGLRFIPWVGPFLAMDAGDFGAAVALMISGVAQIAGTVLTVVGGALYGTRDESEPFVAVEAGPTGLRVRGAF